VVVWQRLRGALAAALLVAMGAACLVIARSLLPPPGPDASLTEGVVRTLPLALIAGTVTALVGGGLAWLVLRPLGPLARAMGEVAEGRESPPLEEVGSQQVRRAIRSFGQMYERIQQTQHDLEEINRNLEAIVAARTRELRRSEQKYRSLVGQANEGILLWQPDTLQILEANARAGELLGVRPRDLLTRTFDSCIAAPVRRVAVRALRTVSGMGAASLDEVQLLREGGGIFPAEVGASLVRFGEERVVLGILRDLAPKKDLERKTALINQHVMQTEKMTSIGLLAAGVAHEINSPMGYVSSNANRLVEYAKRLEDLFQQGPGVPGSDRTEAQELLSDLDEIARETREGVQRVTEIVSALREFAHGGTKESAYDLVDLNRVIRNCLTLVHNQIKNRATVELDLEPLRPVRCHRTQIAQVLMNLVRNAADAVTPPGRIRISSYDSGSSLHVAVEDEGGGIDPAHLEHLFEPFFTTKPVGAGMGLGLAVSREIVRRHSGDLTVDSVVGRGTRFLLELPRESSPDEAG
jgi:PAS domain S-box-containing protein